MTEKKLNRGPGTTPAPSSDNYETPRVDVEKANEIVQEVAQENMDEKGHIQPLYDKVMEIINREE